MVGYGYVHQFLWEWLLTIFGNYSVMRLREITMANKLVSENSPKDLLLIASTIPFQMILGPRKRTYLRLIKLMKERHFLLALHFVFIVLLLLSQRSELFME